MTTVALGGDGVAGMDLLGADADDLNLSLAVMTTVALGAALGFVDKEAGDAAHGGRVPVGFEEVYHPLGELTCCFSIFACIMPLAFEICTHIAFIHLNSKYGLSSMFTTQHHTRTHARIHESIICSYNKVVVLVFGLPRKTLFLDSLFELCSHIECV